MAAAYAIATVTSPFSTGAQGMVASLNAWLGTVGLITIVAVDVWREDSATYTGVQRVRIAYVTGRADVPSGYSASIYRSGPGVADAAQQFNDVQSTAFNPRTAQFMFDLTDLRGSASGLTFLVISANLVENFDVYQLTSALIAEPLVDIAPGAFGLCTMITASGSSIAAGVTNIGADTWVAGQRSYVTVDAVSGEWVGLPSCCSGSLAPLAPPALTTTPPFPCPAYVAQTPPVLP